ncbi:unnamed protein product [Cuscuta campestris]|uniref:Phosphoinositide phospholipase C n=1 Tax=Cuscuta campestris TaxID=132261 RepID=A0A484MTJ4_9ASTE|nr:unnamed protein product [Cuscuta campestris]
MSHQRFRLCCCFLGFKLRGEEAPEQIRSVFENYSDENGIMTADNLLKFLKEFQKENEATIETAEKILREVKRLNHFHHKGLVIDEFFRYLLNDDLNNALKTTVHHDMNAPLAHYFIFTGHNSYLTGNQICSKSSVDPIVKALKRGVRVIELDLWPNSKMNDIIVWHGGTFTSKVKLIKCLKAIKNFAFVASAYPLIITFEDHLKADLQAQVAKVVVLVAVVVRVRFNFKRIMSEEPLNVQMVKQIFQEMLFCPESDLTEFPSPESLKGRIVISTKLPRKYSKSGTLIEPHTINETISSRNELLSIHGSQHLQAEEILEGNADDEDGLERTPEYKNVIAIHASKLNGSKHNLPSHDHKVTRLSMSEETLKHVVNIHGRELIGFTQRNFLRVYPKGSRITSSNYNPLIGWTHGAQMVAFNMQGHEKHLRIMQGMFRANGGCGYLKKPAFLLGDGDCGEVFHPSALTVKTTLKVNIYMGEGWREDFHFRHFDYCSPPDFYAKVKIVGVSCDRTKSERTKKIDDQWLPSWNGKEFEFPLRVPELALLLVAVKDHDPAGGDEFGGQTCLPVSELKTGFRCVPLYDRRGDKYSHVKLLMGFQFV